MWAALAVRKKYTPCPWNRGLRYRTFDLDMTSSALGLTARLLEITIHVYDYSALPAHQMIEAKRTATTILSQAGITSHWKDCAVPGIKTAGPSCGSGTYDFTHFVVGILPEPMSVRISSSPLQFGKAIMHRAGGLPTHAYVFADRVMNLSKATSTPTAFLGVIIAHELGHLLLGADSHFTAGIMRASWNPSDVGLALTGAVSFTPKQAREIRNNVLRRMNEVN
jgi:hypothetical protein